MFSLLQFFWTVWEGLVLVLLWCLVNLHVKPTGPELLCAGRFLITASISLVVIGLCRFYASSWFSVGRLHVSRYFSISSSLSSFLDSVHSNFLQSFVFLWYRLLLLLFHFWFYLFKSSLLFSWWVWLKVCQFCLSFQITRS